MKNSLFRPAAFCCALAIIWSMLLPAAASTGSNERVAVVIGNSSYPSAELTNPRNDARLVARTLQDLGFDVSLYLDTTAEQTPLLEEEIKKKLASADVSVLYYAGHGLQYKGQNLLLPVDTDISSVKGIDKAGIRLNELLKLVTSGAGGIKLVILDACRNSLSMKTGKDLQAGFSFVEAPSGEVLIAFSTGAGELAYDSAGGTNSPYATALANALQQSGAGIYDVFRSVRRAVRSGTGGLQIPWITGSIETNYIFRPAPAAAAPAASADGAGRDAQASGAPAAGADKAAAAAAAGLPTIDSVLWEFIQSSRDPSDFARFVAIFPNSVHAGEAKRLSEIRVASAETETLSRDGTALTREVVATDASASSLPTPDQGRTKPLLDQSGEYVMRNSFRTWPTTLPDAGGGIGTIATSCDEEAADPVDPLKFSPGISDGFVNIGRALRACAFDLAADPQNPRLLFQLGRVLEVARRFDWANAYYDAAIARGYSAAMVNRGTNARLGRGGDRDLALAYKLYRMSALVGNPRGRVNLARSYQLGEGVDKNEAEAVLWVRLSASMGWPFAVNYLGDLYLGGIGLPKDAEEAVALYRMSAGQGLTTGMANVGLAYLNGTGVERDSRVGLDWLDKALNLGNGFAPVYSGRFYLKGDARVRADKAKAQQLFEAATRRGNPIGYLELAKGYDAGLFAGGKDPAAAYRNALFAQAGHAKGADEIVDKTRAALPADRQKAVEADVKLFLLQNGL